MEIGKSVLYYDENGKLDRIEFAPTMKVELDSKELVKFAKITGHDEVTIAISANAAVATWFQKTNEIELADRSQWQIETKVDACSKLSNGRISKCSLTHYFKHIEHETEKS